MHLLRSFERSIAFLSLSFVLALSGCGDDERCELVADAQPTRRLPVGTTYFFPAAGDVCQPDASWSAVSGPNGEAAAVYVDGDGIARFTPQAAGDYRFSRGDELELTITAVDPGELPFHNFNYYGTRTQAVIGDELWVAKVYAPEIERLDADTLTSRGRITVGPWPVAIAWQPGMTHAVVAHRAGDTLGLVDVESAALEDSIWVGDEPSNVVVSRDGTTAYATLGTDGTVVVVDLAARAVTARVAAVADPLALALSPDDARLYVASQRSGQPGRFPFEDDPVEEERDLVIIDTATLEIDTVVFDLASNINALLPHPDGRRVYVSARSNDTRVLLQDPESPSFRHRVLIVDAEDGELQLEVDLSRQPTSEGFAVEVHGIALAGSGDAERLWATAEGSDLAIALDPDSLEELERVAAPGRPRHVMGTAERVYVHGAQSFRVTSVAADGTGERSAELAGDPRPPLVARGQAFFTGAGAGFAVNWACNSCHASGLTDTLVWNAGPFEDRVVSRPFFWLEGTYPLGWAGYLSNVRNYAYTVTANIDRAPPTTSQVEGLWNYLASIMPPPAARTTTGRDGALSETAERGRVLYEGKAACASCHPLPLTTTRVVLDAGVTEGITDIPALVGAYRHGVWLKRGEARTLRVAIEDVARWLDADLSADELDDLTAYVEELTGRDFFVLASEPRADAAGVGIFAAPRLTFSLPVWADSAAEGVRLETEDGEPVTAAIAVADRHIDIVPDEALAYGTTYVVVVEPELESADERAVTGATEFRFTTAEEPVLELGGDYVWTVDMPVPDFEQGGFDPERSVPISSGLEATSAAGGAGISVQLAADLVYGDRAVIDGDTLRVAPMPAPAGRTFVDSDGLRATLFDDDGDGVADRADGTLTISGPGFLVPGVTWQLARPDANPGECVEGPSGEPATTLVLGDGGVPVFDWQGNDGENAIAFYVTDPGATLPTGAGMPVTNGDTYWALATQEFPAGFAGPIVYGDVPDGANDDGATHGAPEGGAPLEPGVCYEFSVVTNQFRTGKFQIVMPE